MPLDVFQQIFTLSVAANIGNSLKGTESSLQKALQHGVAAKVLPTLGGDWKLVWGPVVWKDEPDNADTGPDNSWYIAFHPRLRYEDGSERPTYVIAIAGTPFKSMYTWFQHNLAVNTISDFKAWIDGGIKNQPSSTFKIVPGNPYVAIGTVSGVHKLLNTPAPDGAESAGKTLLEYITHLDKSASPRFITTGHSLGGALSPTLALALVLSKTTPPAHTLTYPSAGPSPGNVEFADLFTEHFPARRSDDAASYQGWNLNLVNELDVVPHAWCIDADLSPKQNLYNIPAIYGKPVIAGVGAVSTLAIFWSKDSGIVYKPIQSQYFTGPRPDTAPGSLEEFLKILHPQHLEIYYEKVGITVESLKESIHHDGVYEKSEEEMMYSYPVLIDFEWAMEHADEAKQIEEKVECTK